MMRYTDQVRPLLVRGLVRKAPVATTWVAVKELKLGYHNSKAIFLTAYLNYGN